MNHLKTLGLAAVAVAALMAFAAAGTASATVLCKTQSNPCSQRWPKGTKLEFSLRAGTTAVWTEQNRGVVLKTCTEGRLEGETINEGSASETVKLSVAASQFQWNGCSRSTFTIEGGELEIHSISGTENGTVTMKGLRFTTNSIFGSCTYGSATAIDLGTLTTGGSGEVVLDVNALLTETTGICCPAVAWTEEFKLTSPSGTQLFVEPS